VKKHAEVGWPIPSTVGICLSKNPVGGDSGISFPIGVSSFNTSGRILLIDAAKL